MKYEPAKTGGSCMKLPLRVDFAGGWLDVPRFAISGEYVVNCAIQPLASIRGNAMEWQHQPGLGTFLPSGSGLGSSAAWHMLRGDDVAAIETAAGCGWQDHAVIQETGLCVWASGATPELVHQDSGEWLRGLMAIRWTGKSHCTSKIVDLPRDYEAIARAAIHAFKAVQRQSVHELAEAIDMTAEEQYREGMDDLPLWGLAAKYCGAGHGGYAMYLFDEQEQRDRAVSEKDMVAVEPYFKPKEVTK